jgi:hypothetical protein
MHRDAFMGTLLSSTCQNGKELGFVIFCIIILSTCNILYIHSDILIFTAEE